MHYKVDFMSKIDPISSTFDKWMRRNYSFDEGSQEREKRKRRFNQFYIFTFFIDTFNIFNLSIYMSSDSTGDWIDWTN